MRYHIPHLHVPDHDFVLKIEHLFCDKRFWVMVGITVIILGLLAIALWAGQGKGTMIEDFPFRPMYPYLHLP